MITPFSSARLVALSLMLATLAPSTALARPDLTPANRERHHRRAASHINDAVRPGMVRVRRRKLSNGKVCTVKNSTESTSEPSSVGGGLIAVSSAAPEPSASASVEVSASAPGPSPSSSTGGGSSRESSLFPLGRGSSSWTTASDLIGARDISSAIKPLSAGKLPGSTAAPDGSDSVPAYFHAGAVGLKNGEGLNFYSTGPDSWTVEGAKEIVMSYSIWFEEGLDFVKGGKLPGVYGGTSLESAKSCSGGRQDDRDDCFSARLMFRTNGEGEIYNYLPSSVSQGSGYCETAPWSTCNADYGDSIGRGKWSWTTGSWNTVAIRVRLNDVGQSNGEQEIFINGASQLSLSGLQIRVKDDTKFYGIMAQTFFGGHTADWAPSKDQAIYFKDWSIAVTA